MMKVYYVGMGGKKKVSSLAAYNREESDFVKISYKQKEPDGTTNIVLRGYGNKVWFINTDSVSATLRKIAARNKKASGYKNPARSAVNEDAVRELVLFIENDGDLYRQRTTPIIENLRKKIAKGIFDYEKSLTLWLELADAGAKKYTKEFGSVGEKWSDLFTKGTRQLVAIDLADYYAEEVFGK